MKKKIDTTKTRKWDFAALKLKNYVHNFIALNKYERLLIFSCSKEVQWGKKHICFTRTCTCNEWSICFLS